MREHYVQLVRFSEKIRHHPSYPSFGFVNHCLDPPQTEDFGRATAAAGIVVIKNRACYNRRPWRILLSLADKRYRLLCATPSGQARTI